MILTHVTGDGVCPFSACSFARLCLFMIVCVCVCVCACACACVRVSGGGLQDNSIRPGSTRGLHAAETALTPEVLTAHHKNAGCLSLASDV